MNCFYRWLKVANALSALRPHALVMYLIFCTSGSSLYFLSYAGGKACSGGPRVSLPKINLYQSCAWGTSSPISELRLNRTCTRCVGEVASQTESSLTPELQQLPIGRPTPTRAALTADRPPYCSS